MSEVLNEQRYRLESTGAEETAFRLFSLIDEQTGIKMTFPEPNAEIDYATSVAWLGANTSRNDTTFDAGFKTLRESLDDDPLAAANKFGNVFANYGHASVGDMATVPLLIDNVPGYIAYRMFSATSLGSGQEWSTRYGKKDAFNLPELAALVGSDVDPELSARWESVQEKMATGYKYMFDLLRPSLDSFLQANGHDTDTPSAQNTLNARTLDVARMFIPFGYKTKMAYVDSARDWVRMAGVFNQSQDPTVRAFGEQITAMLLLDQRTDVKLHLEKFTKYAEGTDTANRSLAEVARLAIDLSGFSTVPPSKAKGFERSRVELTRDARYRFDSQTVIASALMGANPELDPRLISLAVSSLFDVDLAEISAAAFAGHNQFEMMHPAFDIRGIAMTYESSLAYLRDINRHRSFGRHIVQFSSDDKPMAALNNGINDNYALRESEYWSEHRAQFNVLFEEVYEDLFAIIGSLEESHGPVAANAALQHIIPLGAQMRMILSAPVQQWNYMASLRVGLGGDFGYRDDVWNMLQLIRDADPGMASMAGHLVKPDLNNAMQILGRS